MSLEETKPSDEQKAKSSANLLRRLRDQLRSSNASVRRKAAFHLSWLQEDGLDILKKTLFSNLPKSTKNAAAYGLRKMRGRMKKAALEVFNEGLRSQDRETREVCKHALTLLGKLPQQETAVANSGQGKVPIREIRSRANQRPQSRARTTNHRRRTMR